jgi:hypothetical protein
MNFDPSSMTQLSVMLYVAIKYGLPKGSRPPTQAQVDEWMTDADFEQLNAELGTCLMNSIPSFKRMMEAAQKKPKG